MKIPKIDTDLDLKSIELYILFCFFRKGVSKIQLSIRLGEAIFQIEFFVSAFAQHSLSLFQYGDFMPNLTT